MVLKQSMSSLRCVLCLLLQLDQYNQRIQDKRELHYQEIRNLKKQGVWKRQPSLSQGISLLVLPLAGRHGRTKDANKSTFYYVINLTLLMFMLLCDKYLYTSIDRGIQGLSAMFNLALSWMIISFDLD